MSERTADALSDANELLGQMVDLAIKFRSLRSRFGCNEAYCVYCGDTGHTPPEVRHKHGCVVAKAKALLNS